MRLGKHLNNEKLTQWALYELNGYDYKENLPEYRIHSSEVVGHFSVPFGSGIRNAHIPKIVIEKEHRDILFTNYMMQPVAELEQLTEGDKGEALISYWPADFIVFYQRKEIYQGMVLSSAWRTLTKPSISGILDNIRTRILEFALRIEQELSSVSNKMSKDQKLIKPNSERILQIFNNTIYSGNVSVGNIGNISQTINKKNKGNFDQLKKYFTEIGLTETLINELKKSLNKDVSSKTLPGRNTSNWISKVMVLIGKGTISLTTNTAASLISTAILKYLGI